MDAKQTNLFDLEINQDVDNTKSPVIVSTNSKKKSTNQINTKIKKIERLKNMLSKLEDDIVIIKKTYEKAVTPKQNKLFKIKEAFVIQIHSRWKQKGFTNWQKDLMENILNEETNFLYNHGFESKLIDNINKEITEHQKERLDPFEKEMMNDMAKEMFSDFGIDVDDDFDLDKFDFDSKENDYFKEFNKKQQQFEKETIEQSKKEKVLNTDKQFQKIYKSLVKKTHPDLVISKEEKDKREVLMKRLSEVWENRDYYQLLLLKAEIEQDGQSVIEIDDNQTKSLIKQLNEEIQDVEAKIMFTKKFDDDNSFFYQNFHFRSKNNLNQKISKFNKNLEEQLEHMDFCINRLKTKNSTKEFLKDSREAFDYEDNSDFFDFI